MRLARAARSSGPLTIAAALAAIGVIGCGDTPRSPRLTVPPKLSVGPKLSVLPPYELAPTFTDTLDNVHLGLAFDYHAHDSAAVAHAVDYIFGGLFVDWNFGFNPPVNHTDAYIPFDTDGYPQTIPGHSLRDWQARHPDWIVYQCDRKTPAYYGAGNTNVPLDFSNPAVQAYQLHEAAVTFRRGADGVAFDNFTFANYESRCGVYRHGVWASLGYPGAWKRSPGYDSAMLAWLRNMHLQIRQQFPGKSLGLNVNFFVSGVDKVPLITPFIDVAFDEAGFSAYGGHRLSGTAWEQQASLLEYLGDHGKAVDINGIVNAPDDAKVSHDDLNWVLANYLLVKRQHTYTYVYAGNHGGFTGSPSGYGTFYDRPEYHIQIGHPTSNRFASSGVEVRYYSGGLVLVNPSASQLETVPLDAAYRDMFGRPYTTSVTLPPVSAIVLLNGQ